jgi:hypothetical protein
VRGAAKELATQERCSSISRCGFASNWGLAKLVRRLAKVGHGVTLTPRSRAELVSAAPLAIEPFLELDMRDRPGRVQVDPLATRNKGGRC